MLVDITNMFDFSSKTSESIIYDWIELNKNPSTFSILALMIYVKLTAAMFNVEVLV